MVALELGFIAKPKALIGCGGMMAEPLAVIRGKLVLSFAMSLPRPHLQ